MLILKNVHNTKIKQSALVFHSKSQKNTYRLHQSQAYDTHLPAPPVHEEGEDRDAQNGGETRCTGQPGYLLVGQRSASGGVL